MKWSPQEEDFLQKLLKENSDITRSELSKAVSEEFGTLRTQDSIKHKLGNLKSREVDISNPKRETDLAKALTQEQKFKGEISSLKKQNKQLAGRILSQEEIFSLFADEAFTSRKKVKLIKRSPKVNTKLPNRDGIVIVSDCQIGQLVEKDKIVVNEFSWKEFERRLSVWSDAVIRDTIDYSKGHNVSSLRFALVGDMVEGHNIFNGQPYALDKLAIEQTYYGVCAFEEAFIYVISTLTEELGSIPIRFYCVVGNHGVPGGRKTSGTGVLGLNYDYGFYLFLKKALNNSGLDYEFRISKDRALLFETMGQIFCMVHGDEVQGWSGLPFYGLEKFDARNIRYLDVIYKNIILGHHHQQAMLPGGRGKKFINGCWPGANDLSASNRWTTMPEQLMLWNSRKFGVTHVTNIALVSHERMDREFKPIIYDEELT